MIANNFFTALGDFFTDVLFMPFDKMRTLNWWESNTINFILLFIGLVAFGYWMGQMRKNSREENL